MAMSIEKFKRARAAKSGRGRYPADARTWAARYAETRIRRGRRIAAIAAELGISDMTLRAWLYAATRESPGELCEVVVAEAEPPSPRTAVPRSLSVTTVQGHVVMGLDAEGVVVLLKALG